MEAVRHGGYIAKQEFENVYEELQVSEHVTKLFTATKLLNESLHSMQVKEESFNQPKE